MSKSHKRRTDPDAPPTRTLGVIVRAVYGEFKVLPLAPQYPGGPEHVVVQANDAVAHFFSVEAALDYVEWKNKEP